MKLTGLITLGARFAKARVTGARAPLSVIFEVTQRCNLRCKYCSIWREPPPELSLAEIRPLVDEMGRAGVKVISLVGGEPFLRDDLEQIGAAIESRGMSVALCTNGHGFADRVATFPGLSHLVISLDGLQPNHDALRGKGAFNSALTSLRAGVARGVSVMATMTVTRKNLGVIRDVLQLAEGEGFRMNFQPVMTLRYASTKVDELAPSIAEFRGFMDEVIDAKRGGAPIFGSLGMLRFIREHWRPGAGFHSLIRPRGASHAGEIPCYAGQFFCSIGSDGTLSPCDLLSLPPERLPNVRDGGFMAAVRALPLPDCAGCWCTPYLLRNMGTSLRPGAVLEVLRVLMESA